jgi:hypothetical protein
MVEAKGLYFRGVAGLVSGMFAGVVSGLVYLVMTVKDSDGLSVSLLTVISRALGQDDPAVGWSFHLFNSGVAGILFGLVLGHVVNRLGRAEIAGLVMGCLWWGLSGLLVLPALLNQSSWALSSVALQPVLLGTLAGSLVYGVLLGTIFRYIYLPVAKEDDQKMDQDPIHDEERAPHTVSRAA